MVLLKKRTAVRSKSMNKIIQISNVSTGVFCGSVLKKILNHLEETESFVFQNEGIYYKFVC